MHNRGVHQTGQRCKQGARGIPQRVEMHKVQVGQCCAQGSQTEPKAGKTERNGGDANEGDVHRQDRVKTTRRTVDTSRMRNPKITSLHGSACLNSSWKFASTQVDNMEVEMGKRCEGHKDKSGPANLTCFCTWVQHMLRTREQSQQCPTTGVPSRDSVSVRAFWME